MAWWHFIKFCRKLFKQIGEDDLSGRAAEMAYKFFLALFPFMIFLVAAGSFVADVVGIDDPTQELIDQVGPSSAADARSLLRDPDRGRHGDQEPGAPVDRYHRYDLGGFERRRHDHEGAERGARG